MTQIKSKPSTPEYRDNYDRIFKPRKEQYAHLCESCSNDCFTEGVVLCQSYVCKEIQNVS